MEDLQGAQALVDAAHEALEEDDLGEADGEAAQVTREGVEVVEVMQLHGVREVQSHVAEDGTFVTEFVEHGGRDQLGRQLNVSVQGGHLQYVNI